MRPTDIARHPLATLTFFLLVPLRLLAAPGGPTLELDYGRGRPLENSVCQFMYFVPLIAPGPSTIFTNAGNRQSARVLTYSCQRSGTTLHATCEFEFTGEGELQNIFDPTHFLHEHEAELKAGVILKHQLGAINVTGAGHGSVEVEGETTNGVVTVSKVAIHFNGHGSTSPVTIDLMDFVYRNGHAQTENDMVARVNSLVFQRGAGSPMMEVLLASLKPKDAGESRWQNFVGDLKGATVNLFLPPLKIEAEGQQTMLDFGRALASQNPAFTFPLATRLKGIGGIPRFTASTASAQ